MTMTFVEARQRLQVHSGMGGLTEGFLNMLRPYRGLRDEVFRDLAQAVEAVLPHLREGPLDHEVVNALWGIDFFARYWGVAPDGMLRANGLISAADVERLSTWTTAVGWAVAMALDGQDDALCLSELRLLPESGLR